MVGTFNLPDVGEGLTEAEVMSWKVAVGDVVEVNDVVVEIETAKSAVELPIPFAGEVRELLAQEGETLEVGSPLIRIAEAGAQEAPSPQNQDDGASAGPGQDDPGGDGSGLSGSAQPEPAHETQHQGGAAEQAAPDQDSAAGTDSGGDKALVGSGPKADAARRRPRTRPTALDLVEGPEQSGRSGPARGAQPAEGAGQAAADILARTTPPVRALARKLGVALWELGAAGSGPITRDHVERVAHQRTSAGGALSNGRAGGEHTSSFSAGLLREGPREEDVEVRGVRKHTAINVTKSAQEVPHVSVFREVDVTRTSELRRSLREDPRYEGLSVSPLLFVAKAIIWAARRNPQVNATWNGDTYTLKNYVNLGIAAATPRGLVVPVIKDAQDYDTAGLAGAITELTSRARDGKTAPAEMQGGTVSITNLGPLGLDGGTPILPPGQAAIIAVGAVRRKPWVVEEQIVPRDVMTVGGSFDHRLIDGQHAGHFVADIARVLEQPGLLLN